ncbi:MAG: cupin domain-containing protein [Candidatus Hydrogenedentes bacterium]|jgi:mannose-6-phosphate isomerase-like protein (cupin superfamily)|nr:cupin domain-containing protein [Candidatus Hydrogenedentota bacterium]
MIRKHADMEGEVREHMRGGPGSVTFKHLFKKEEFTANVRFCAMGVIPPGAGIGPHTHEAEDEVYIITRGSGILDDGRTQSRVSAGDAILTGNGESHAIYNDGEEPLELIAVIACYPEPKQP